MARCTCKCGNIMSTTACPSKCGRIYVFDGGYNPAIAVYKLEEEGEKDRGGK